MNTLARLIAERIRTHGPMTVDEFMALANGERHLGYYMRREPFGRAGDFVTAPEISQMFGELVGLWCAATWERMGRPPRALLVELGPGRGTLMADALRAIAGAAPQFRRAIDLHLVETSARLRVAQAKTLADAAPVWHDMLDETPRAPMLLIANEFFDALPVRQLLPDGRERRVGIEGDRLAFLDGADQVREESPARQSVAAAIADRLVQDGGAALIFDYGHARPGAGDTLQAVARHRYAPPLENPGEADLSAHVDFVALAEAARARGASVFGPVAQGDFLRALGIEARAARLAQGATAQAATNVALALDRLTKPQAMGALFKAMAIAAPGFSSLDGFPPC